MQAEIVDLILDLFEIKAIQFGNFTLKSGISSPIYIDLRLIISYPHLLKKIGTTLWPLMAPLSFDRICGVPYTALPIATCLSIQHDIPMILRRKESKNYGLKKMVEGAFEPNQKCLIIEDLITSGTSILETTDVLQQEGLIVSDAVAILNREQGGEEKLKERGIQIHALMTLSELLATLKGFGKISSETVEKVKEMCTS